MFVSTTQVQKAVCLVMDKPGSRTLEARALNVAREFKAAGDWPKGKGSAPGRVKPVEAVRLTAALAFADDLRDAAEIGDLFFNLPIGDGNIKPKGLTLGRFLERTFEGREPFTGPLTLALSPNGSAYADINIVTNGLMKETAFQIWEGRFWNNPSWGAFARREYTVSAEGLMFLRKLLLAPDEEHEPQPYPSFKVREDAS
jgi:hypothetical protein